MLESLDEFGKLDEFDEMSSIIGGMMAKQSENMKETETDAEVR